MRPLLNLFSVLLALSSKFALGGPPCSGERPVPICAEFITPFFYNGEQWGSDCLAVLNTSVLIAYNIPGSFNASEPDCGYPGYYTAACCNSYTFNCDLGYDCDTESSRPVPYGDSVMPTGWSIYSTPCAIDSPPGSVFVDATVQYNRGLLPYYCAQSCDSQGYTYAGVEMGDQCWCGSGLASTVQSAPLGEECNWPCQGGYTYSCGAYERIQIFTKS